MGISTIFAYKFMIYINLSNAIATILSIVVAIVVYMLFVLVLRILNKDEIVQLPYGNKICKLVYKTQK